MRSVTENPGVPFTAADDGPAFARKHWPLLLLISALVLIPCFWHRHIEAGDLGSHVYNAWLAKLIGEGKAPGLYIARQWHNVLCDIAFLYLGKTLGFAAAEKIVVSICVLIFFWGIFTFIGVATTRVPWFLVPAIAMLTYGYAFSMGFLNYYVSLALACFGLAATWRRGHENWPIFIALMILSFVAHPIGFLWLVGMSLYRFLHKILPRFWKLAVPVAVLAAVYGLHWYLSERATFEVDWTAKAWYRLNGADQLWIYGRQYAVLSDLVLAFVVLCVAVELAQRLRAQRTNRIPQRGGEPPSETPESSEIRRTLFLALEFYVVAFCTTAFVPENLRPDPEAGWIGLLVSRLTLITAIFGLLLLGCLRPRKWHLAGFTAAALTFFGLLYRDTRWIADIERNAERAVSTLPFGTRVIVDLQAPSQWRAIFVGHSAERACIGGCFVYSNYEPATRQFRVRVSPQGSSLATSSSDEAENMQAGNYTVKPSDPPLVLLYQCDDHDLRQLCLHALKPGEKTEEPDEIDPRDSHENE